MSVAAVGTLSTKAIFIKSTDRDALLVHVMHKEAGWVVTHPIILKKEAQFHLGEIKLMHKGTFIVLLAQTCRCPMSTHCSCMFAMLELAVISIVTLASSEPFTDRWTMFVNYFLPSSYSSM